MRTREKADLVAVSDAYIAAVERFHDWCDSNGRAFRSAMAEAVEAYMEGMDQMDRTQVFNATVASRYGTDATGRPQLGRMRVIVETDELSRPMADRIISQVDATLGSFSHARIRRQEYRSDLLGPGMAVEIREVKDEAEEAKAATDKSNSEASTEGRDAAKPVAASVSGGTGKNRKRSASV